MDLQGEIRSRLVSYLVAAFGLVAGLAWNEAVKDLINHFFPLNSDALWAKFLYAVIITVLVVVVSVILLRLSGKKDDGEGKKCKKIKA